MGLFKTSMGNGVIPATLDLQLWQFDNTSRPRSMSVPQENFALPWAMVQTSQGEGVLPGPHHRPGCPLQVHPLWIS